jgi:cytochrome P450
MVELSQQDPFDPAILTCPHQYNQQLREQAPVYHCPKTGIYFISNYELVTEVAKNHKVFSSKFSNLMTAFKLSVTVPKAFFHQKRLKAHTLSDGFIEPAD